MAYTVGVGTWKGRVGEPPHEKYNIFILGGYFSHSTAYICTLNKLLHYSLLEFQGFYFEFPGF